jgi:hypothetical protein
LDVFVQEAILFSIQMLLGVSNTQVCAQGVEDIGELQHCLVPFLPQCGPSHVTVFIVSDMVIFPLKSINKRCPSGFNPKNFRFVCGGFLIVSLPPIFDMGENLKEGESDLFSIRKIIDWKITFY